MSYTNGFQTVQQSMNGVLSFNDGQGGILENGTITVNEIDTNNIKAAQPSMGCSLFSNIVGGISVILGNTLSYIQVPGIFSANTIRTYTAGVVNLYTDVTSALFNIGTNSTGTIQIGNTTNINTVGAVNFQANNITTSGSSGTANILNNLTTGAINMGTGLLSGRLLTLGNTANTNKIGGINIINQSIEAVSTGSSSTASLFGTSTLGIINIASGLTSGGQINIGNPSGTGGVVSIGNSTNLNYLANVTAQGQTINPVDTNSNMNIFTNQGTGILSLGTSAKKTNLNGIANMQAFSFTSGNLTTSNSASGFLINSGVTVTLTSGTVAANNRLLVQAGIAHGFSSAPKSITCTTYNIDGGNSVQRCFPAVYDVTTTTFSIDVWNPGSVGTVLSSTVRLAVYWTAIGQY